MNILKLLLIFIISNGFLVIITKLFKNNYFEINNEFKSDKTYNKIYIRYTSG